MLCCATPAILLRTSCGARTGPCGYARSLTFEEAMNLSQRRATGGGTETDPGLSVYTLNKLLIFTPVRAPGDAEGAR